MYKKIKINFVVAITLTILSIGVVFAMSIYASKQELTFSTIEKENSLLDSNEGQEQVRLIQLNNMQELRRLEEERIAEELLIEEKRIAEELLIEEKRIEEERIIEEEIELAAQAAKQEENEEKQEKIVSIKSEVSSNDEAVTTSTASVQSENGRSLGFFEATAYGPDCYGCSGVTANGTDIRNGNIYSNGYRVIAADPRVIPLNSIVKITYSTGQTEMAIVADTGGRIKGNIIDIAFGSEAEANPFGRQQVQIELIN